MNINDVYRRNEKKGYYLFECTHYSLCKFFIDSNLGVNNAPENRTHSISLHVCFVSAFSYPKVSPGDDELVRCWRMRFSRRISDEFISNRIMICLIASSYLPMGFRLILKWVIQCFFFRAFNVFHTIAFCIRMLLYCIHLCTNGFSRVQLYDFRFKQFHHFYSINLFIRELIVICNDLIFSTQNDSYFHLCLICFKKQ